MTTKRINPRMKIELHGPSSGGGGKSSSALDSASIARLSGLEVLLLDADRGNAALSDSLGPRYEIKFLPPRFNESYAVELISSCLERGIDLLIIDLGANAMTDAEIEAMIISIFKEAIKQLCACRVCLSLQPAKRGLLSDALLFAERFAELAEVYLNFRKGMDRTAYAELIDRVDGTITVPNYEVAVLDLLKDSRLLPSDWISSPQPGFERAAAVYAKGLLERSREPHFRNWLGSDETEQWLELKAADAPKRRYIGLNQRGEVTNERLDADERFLMAEARLKAQTAQSDDASVLECAREYITAHSARIRQIASGL